MLTIEINKDIEEYKDDFWKGLSGRECIYAAATLITGTIMYLVCNKLAGLPSNLSVYMALAIAAPIALCGFYRRGGMYFSEIVKRYVRIAFAKPSVYFTDYREILGLAAANAADTEKPAGKKKREKRAERKRRKQK